MVATPYGQARGARRPISNRYVAIDARVQPVSVVGRDKDVTWVELAILVVLESTPAHGYDIVRRLQTAFGEVGRFSYGSIYPALSRLQRAGLVSIVGTASKLESSRLPGLLAAELVLASTTLRGRARRTYRITEDGKRRLAEALETAEMSDDRFATIALVAQALVTPNNRHTLCSRRQRMLRERIEDLDRLAQDMPHLWLAGVRARLEAEYEALRGALDDPSEEHDHRTTVW